MGVWTSAEDALKKIDAFRPQVVLMDINLPGMSGIDATARIKLHLPELQVIMVTVYRDHDQIFAALGHDADRQRCSLSRHSDIFCPSSRQSA